MAAIAAKDVRSREDFVRFARQLAQSVPSLDPQTSNRDLGDYLEALSGWVNDMDGYFLNKGQPMPKEPTWSLLAQILEAAMIYE